MTRRGRAAARSTAPLVYGRLVHEQVCGGWTACDQRIVGRQTATTLKAAEVTCPGCREVRRVAEAHLEAQTDGR